MALLGNRVVVDVIMMRSYWSGWALIQNVILFNCFVFEVMGHLILELDQISFKLMINT